MNNEITNVEIIGVGDDSGKTIVSELNAVVNNKINELRGRGCTIVRVEVQPMIYNHTVNEYAYRFYQTAIISYSDNENICNNK